MYRPDCAVSRDVYIDACEKLYNKHGEKPRYTGPVRQELQQIKHANDKHQKGPNPYAGPKDKSDDAQRFLNSLK